jgi:hypothetical protein
MSATGPESTLWRLGLAGVLAAMATAAAGQSSLPRIPTAQLRPGSHSFVADPYSEPPNESQILLIRETGGRLRAWFIPVRKGSRRLPEDERWTPGAPCLQFLVDFRSGVIGCRDPQIPPDILRRYRWRIDGQHLTEFVPDLIAIPGAEVEGQFILHR